VKSASAFFPLFKEKNRLRAAMLADKMPD